MSSATIDLAEQLAAEIKLLIADNQDELLSPSSNDEPNRKSTVMNKNRKSSIFGANKRLTINITESDYVRALQQTNKQLQEELQVLQSQLNEHSQIQLQQRDKSETFRNLECKNIVNQLKTMGLNVLCDDNNNNNKQARMAHEFEQKLQVLQSENQALMNTNSILQTQVNQLKSLDKALPNNTKLANNNLYVTALLNPASLTVDSNTINQLCTLIQQQNSHILQLQRNESNLKQQYNELQSRLTQIDSELFDLESAAIEKDKLLQAVTIKARNAEIRANKSEQKLRLTNTPAYKKNKKFSSIQIDNFNEENENNNNSIININSPSHSSIVSESENRHNNNNNSNTNNTSALLSPLRISVSKCNPLYQQTPNQQLNTSQLLYKPKSTSKINSNNNHNLAMPTSPYSESTSSIAPSDDDIPPSPSSSMFSDENYEHENYTQIHRTKSHSKSKNNNNVSNSGRRNSLLTVMPHTVVSLRF